MTLTPEERRGRERLAAATVLVLLTSLPILLVAVPRGVDAQVGTWSGTIQVKGNESGNIGSYFGRDMKLRIAA